MSELVTYQDMLDAGVSYRRMYHWTSRGLLRPENPDPGSGRQLRWPAAELTVARLMVFLVDRCEMSPAVASEIARGGGRFEVGDEVYRVVITWELVDQ